MDIEWNDEMLFDIQRAGIWKRACAALLDLILLSVLASGFAWGISALSGFDKYAEIVSDYTSKYSEIYPLYFKITSEAELNALDESERAEYEAQKEAFTNNADAMADYNTAAEANIKAVSLTFVMTSASVLAALLILEIGVPLIMKNGVTVGKKVFGLAVIRQDCVRITPFMLAVRSIAGKYIIEIMVPIWAIVGIYFGIGGLFGVIVPVSIAVLQLILVLGRRNRQAIHDLIACTVVTDYQSQRIFSSAEELLEAQKEASRQESASDRY